MFLRKFVLPFAPSFIPFTLSRETGDGQGQRIVFFSFFFRFLVHSVILRLSSPSVLSLVSIRRFVRVSVLTLSFPPGNFVFFLMRKIRENENMCAVCMYVCVCMYMACVFCVREGEAPDKNIYTFTMKV